PLENYLPSEYFSEFFEKTRTMQYPNKEITKLKSRSSSKFEISLKFTEKYSKFDCSYNEKLSLPEFIEDIYNKISMWNKNYS
ncbi:hypothetical protein HMPREF0027_0113, partial [Actinobacillus ureae ATCC 25976]